MGPAGVISSTKDPARSAAEDQLGDRLRPEARRLLSPDLLEAGAQKTTKKTKRILAWYVDSSVYIYIYLYMVHVCSIYIYSTYYVLAGFCPQTRLNVGHFGYCCHYMGGSNNLGALFGSCWGRPV